MAKRSAVLVSGGIDSAVLLAQRLQAKEEVYPIYIQEGLRWEAIELRHLQHFLKTIGHERLKPLILLQFPMQSIYGKHWSLGNGKVPQARTSDKAVYLPGRNIGLISLAALYCVQKKIQTLFLASLRANPFPDSAPHFFKAFERLIFEGTRRRIQIKTPYRQLGKKEVLHRGKELPLELTFSCIDPKNGGHCGHCNKCAERQRAFKQARIKDKTVYGKKGR